MRRNGVNFLNNGRTTAVRYKYDAPRTTFHDVIQHTCGQCGGRGSELTECDCNDEGCYKCEGTGDVFVDCDTCGGFGYHEHDKN